MRIIRNTYLQCESLLIVEAGGTYIYRWPLIGEINLRKIGCDTFIWLGIRNSNTLW
jgi:hypothetical protein